MGPQDYAVREFDDLGLRMPDAMAYLGDRPQQPQQELLSPEVERLLAMAHQNGQLRGMVQEMDREVQRASRERRESQAKAAKLERQVERQDVEIKDLRERIDNLVEEANKEETT